MCWRPRQCVGTIPVCPDEPSRRAQYWVAANTAQWRLFFFFFHFLSAVHFRVATQRYYIPNEEKKKLV